MEFIATIAAKTYRRKASREIIDYSSGKKAFLEAMAGHVVTFKKAHLVPKIHEIQQTIVN